MHSWLPSHLHRSPQGKVRWENQEPGVIKEGQSPFPDLQVTRRDLGTSDKGNHHPVNAAVPGPAAATSSTELYQPSPQRPSAFTQFTVTAALLTAQVPFTLVYLGVVHPLVIFYRKRNLQWCWETLAQHGSSGEKQDVQAWDMRQDTALPPGDPTAKELINAQLKNAAGQTRLYGKQRNCNWRASYIINSEITWSIRPTKKWGIKTY